VFTQAVTGKNQGLSMTNPFFKDFQGLEFRRKKFKDFQGCVGTLHIGAGVTAVLTSIHSGFQAKTNYSTSLTLQRQDMLHLVYVQIPLLFQAHYRHCAIISYIN